MKILARPRTATATLDFAETVSAPPAKRPSRDVPQAPLAGPPDPPLVGVYGDTDFEPEWLKLEVSLYHEVSVNASLQWHTQWGNAYPWDIEEIWVQKVRAKRVRRPNRTWRWGIFGRR